MTHTKLFLYQTSIAILLAAFAIESSPAETIVTAHQNGEVFDGRAGPLDGIGDEQFNGISSIFGVNFHTSVAGLMMEGQAMAYFATPEISGIILATLHWHINQTIADGAPSITNVYLMRNDSSLSLDDFNKGTLLQSVMTGSYVGGSILTVDLPEIANLPSGTPFGIRLASGDSTGNTFMEMLNNGASITFQTTPIPEPTTVVLFLSGLALVSARQNRRSSACDATGRHT